MIRSDPAAPRRRTTAQAGSLRRFVAATIFVLPCLFFAPSLVAQLAGQGRTFTLSLPFLSPSTNGGAERFLLSFAAEAQAIVTVRYTATGRVESTLVPANSTALMVLDTADLALPQLEGTFNRSLVVEASAPVTAMVVLDRGTASEAYGAVPDSLLGLEYLAVGYQSIGPGSFTVIAATEDETTVTITPNIATLNDRPAGVTFSVMLHKGQVYQLMSKPRLIETDDDDLTGTHITADRPVAVWSGTACARLPVGNITCGPLLEQLVPTDIQGRLHPLGLFASEQQTFYKVVASCPGTSVKGPDLIPALDTVFTDGNGAMTGITFREGIIETSNPALVAHLGVNVSERPPTYIDSAVGDPAMSLVVPVEQMGDKYRFVVPQLLARSDGGLSVGWRHIVNVVRSAAAVQGTLDGTPLVFNGNTAIVQVFPGEHTVQADGPVSVALNGRSVSDAYACALSPVVRTWPLWADSIAGGMCGEELDTTIRLFNLTAADIPVDSVEFVAGLQGDVAAPVLPFIVPAGGSLPVRIRLRNLISGTANGSVVFRSGSCGTRVLRIPVRLRPDRLVTDPSPGSRIDFPPVFPAGPASTRTITLRNPARYPLTITAPDISPRQFTILSPAFPVTIPAGGEQVVTLAFTSTADDRIVEGTVLFRTLNCPEDSTFLFDLHGVVKRLQIVEPEPIRLLCEPKEPDTLVVTYVNRGDAPFRFDVAELRGDAEFTLLPGVPLPLQLLPGDTVRFAVLYVPGPLGARGTMLHLAGAGEDFDSLDTPFRVQNDLLRLSIDRDSLDLGNRACDTAGGGTITIINEGNVPISGMRVSLADGGSARLSADVPDAFEGGDTLRLVISPPDSLYGQLFDTVRVVVPECGLDYRIPVTGRCAVGSLEIAWGEEEGEIGETIEMPLRITARPPGFIRGAQVSVRIVTRMVKDVLLPNGRLRGMPDGLSATLVRQYVRGDDRLVELELNGTLPSDGLLAVMESIALLGSDSVTALAIDTVEFRFLPDVYQAAIITDDGSFRTLGLCNVGFTRLVNSSGAFALRVAPNPAVDATEILLDIVEDGPAALQLVDEAGRQVALLLQGELTAGSWRLTLPLDTLPSGVYRLHLTTRTQALSAPLRVVK